MLDTRFLRASDGTGPAVIARINTQRLAGATVYKVDSVNKWPANGFIATVGSLNANGYLDPTIAPINEFRGTLSGSDIILTSWEPGFPNATTDAGNAVNQYIILKQTTGQANLVQDAVAELQNEDILRQTHNNSDYIQTGGIWSIVSGLNGAMTAVTGYQAGLRATLAAVASRAFTLSKDTYVDLLRGGTIYAPTFTLVYTEVATGATAPALAANSIRLAKVVTNATNITTITQSGNNDGIGNIIRPVGSVSEAQLKNPVKFSVYRAGAHNWNAVGSGWNQYGADTKEYDTGNNWNTSTWQFTVPVTGFYDFTFNCQINSQGGNFGMYPRLYINGNNYREYGQSIAANVNSGVMFSAFNVPLKAGDVVDVRMAGTAASASVGGFTFNSLQGTLRSAD